MLPPESRSAFVERCELVELQRQDVLVQAGQHCEHAYFPIDSFVADIFNLEDGFGRQVDLVGHEGMTNVMMALGLRVATMTCVVQGAGRAFRIHHQALQDAIDSDPAVRDVLYKHVANQAEQLARNMACASSHTVEQRLARWLLIVKDCLHSVEIPMTHEVLSSVLGVRRERVTTVASLLQKSGLISYSRGNLTLLNASGLQAISCGCYLASLQARKNTQQQARPN